MKKRQMQVMRVIGSPGIWLGHSGRPGRLDWPGSHSQHCNLLRIGPDSQRCPLIRMWHRTSRYRPHLRRDSRQIQPRSSRPNQGMASESSESLESLVMADTLQLPGCKTAHRSKFQGPHHMAPGFLPGTDSPDSPRNHHSYSATGSTSGNASFASGRNFAWTSRSASG